MLLAILLLVLPSTALAMDQKDMTTAGGAGGAAIVGAALAGRKAVKKRRHTRAKKIADTEGERWGWNEARREREIQHLVRRRVR